MEEFRGEGGKLNEAALEEVAREILYDKVITWDFKVEE